MTRPRPAVITIAGSDSAGLAGMQMDCRVQHALGAHTHSVITAVTAQNNEGVLAINPVAPPDLASQLAALSSFQGAAIKTGLLTSQEQITAVAHFARASGLPLVCDPVMAATAGDRLADTDLGSGILEALLPHCALLTPNVVEAQTLTGQPIHTTDDMERAAQALVAMGAAAVYLKGGHLDTGNGQVQDYFYSPAQRFWLSNQRVHTRNTRGTGCAFASAAASALALGYALADAVVIARMTVNQGLRQAFQLAGEQKGAVHINGFPRDQQDLPSLTATADFDFCQAPFPPCGETPLGLYPVVDSADWLARLLPLGISTAQLRIKDLPEAVLDEEIRRAVALGRQYDCRLFINDYWKLAIKHKAYGVHLGQEDLDAADIPAIRDAGLRLGTSTHCHYEVARAHTHKPSYVACGPVYPTTTKIMPWIPHGPEGLGYWQSALDYPLVAIGGINQARVAAVAATGASGVAMITAITLADDPEQAARTMMASVEAHRP